MKEEIHPFSVLVRNEPGVLSRVAGLLSRRGFQHQKPQRGRDGRSRLVPDDDQRSGQGAGHGAGP